MRTVGVERRGIADVDLRGTEVLARKVQVDAGTKEQVEDVGIDVRPGHPLQTSSASDSFLGFL
jgi:hypothetical protein